MSIGMWDANNKDIMRLSEYEKVKIKKLNKNVFNLI